MDNFKVLLQSALDKVASKTNINSDIGSLQKQIDKITIKAKLDNESLKNITKQIQNSLGQKPFGTSGEEAGTEWGGGYARGVKKTVNIRALQADISKTISSLNSYSAKNNGFTDFKTQVNGANISMKSLIDQLSKVENTSGLSTIKKEISALKSAFEETTPAISRLSKPINELERATFGHQLDEWKRVNSNAKEFHSRIDQIKAALATVDDTDGLRNLIKQWKELNSAAAALGVKGKSPFDTLTTAGKKFAEWIGPSTVVMSAINSIRDMTSNVKALTVSQLELAKVSDLSANGIKKVTEEAYSLGETVGKTGTQTLNAITSAKRAGYDLKESMNLAEDALKLTNVAEGITDAGVAMESLIHILKGAKKDSSYASNILDMINEVSNTQSVDFDNLVDGGERLSAVATQAGMSLEQMFGVLTGGYEVLGNMEKVASGGITILTRLQSIQLQDEEDVLPVAKLQEKINTATKGVVNVVDQTTGQLRDAYSILDEINSVWNTLDKNTQEGIAFAAGGTRQKSVFLSWMQNWDSVKKSVESATNSLGSADIENAKFLDSLSGKISKFDSAFEHLSQTVLNSDLLKNLTDIGTIGVKSIDGLIQAATPLGTIGAIGGGILGGKGLGGALLFKAI